MLKKITCGTIPSENHGFFTRQGGVSEGVFESLNCGVNSGDSCKAILENLALVEKNMSLQKNGLVNLKQVHSNKVITVNNPSPIQYGVADAMVSNKKGVGLGIMTADCPPVILNDPVNRVIGAMHCGWRGTASGIIQNTLSQMLSLGATLSNIQAAVGPSISQKHYEVGPEFIKIFQHPNKDCAIFFVSGKNDRLLFNLPAFISETLKNLGVQDVEILAECTFEKPTKFFSHRRSIKSNEKSFGRMISVIKQ